MRFISH